MRFSYASNAEARWAEAEKKWRAAALEAAQMRELYAPALVAAFNRRREELLEEGGDLRLVVARIQVEGWDVEVEFHFDPDLVGYYTGVAPTIPSSRTEKVLRGLEEAGLAARRLHPTLGREVLVLNL